MEPIPRLNETVARARAALGAQRGGRDERIAVAPGRVNLLGEHVDYNGGIVLPMAIDRAAVIVARPARAMRLVAADLGETAEPGSAGGTIPADRPWARSVLAVASTLAARGITVPPLELALASTVPIGAGLSSSAAITVAMATVLEAVADVRLDPLDKAGICRAAEQTATGVPCGIMDPLVAVCGRQGHAIRIDCRSHETRAVPMPRAADAVLLVADTGVRRRLARSAYADRRTTCARVAVRLGVETLCAAEPEDLARAALPDLERRRARHVLEEHERAQQGAARLERGDLAAFGALMWQSHASLRDLYEVSCDELDTLVDTARSRQAAGDGDVLGARMTGAGFGGCAIVLCRPAGVDRLTTTLRAAFRAAHGRDADIFPVTAAGSAHLVRT